MSNQIDKMFSEESSSSIRLMTHVVAGYPDLETNKRIIRLMADCGVSLIEIQIPFSDPMADGPTIMKANQHALDNHVTPDDCFRLAEELSGQINVPLLFMTYGNIPFRIGMETFISRSASAGVSGLIVPDLPVDEETDNYHTLTRQYNLHPIPVISPDIRQERLQLIGDKATGFIYTTLKVGITGAMEQIGDQGLTFIDTIRKYSSLPIAAGFGISSPEHVRQLAGKADVAVIGSHIINLFDREGFDAVRTFLTRCMTI